MHQNNSSYFLPINDNVVVSLKGLSVVVCLLWFDTPQVLVGLLCYWLRIWWLHLVRFATSKLSFVQILSCFMSIALMICSSTILQSFYYTLFVGNPPILWGHSVLAPTNAPSRIQGWMICDESKEFLLGSNFLANSDG